MRLKISDRIWVMTAVFRIGSFRSPHHRLLLSLCDDDEDDEDDKVTSRHKFSTSSLFNVDGIICLLFKGTVRHFDGTLISAGQHEAGLAGSILSRGNR